MSGQYFRDAMAALVCFNLSDRASFDSIKKWVGELKKHYTEEDRVILQLVGC